MVPALVLFGLAEVGVRLAVAVEPTLRSVPLGPERANMFRPDADLFWTLAPGLDVPFLGERVVTNQLGLRSPEVAPRREGEYRILSLGESSTFGSGVAGEETYTALLARLLEERGVAERVTAINAGVPAWTSFQSLRYLEQRGLALDPDLVILYHEVNDYLPSSVRDSSQNEIGVLQTDRERWASRRGLLAWLSDRSELVRFLRLRLARMEIDRFDTAAFTNPVAEIGLPRIGIPPRLVRTDGDRVRGAGIKEKALTPRVSPDERRENLAAFRDVTARAGVDLLIVHPAYRDSVPHECLLTRFIEEHRIRAVEAMAALHPPDRPAGALFRDSWHPLAEGHVRLAEALADEISARLGAGGGG